jgi:hypothetical protein
MSNRDSGNSQRERIERLGLGSRNHTRNDSGTTGGASSGGDSGDRDREREREREPQQNGVSRRHDYDVQSMETDLSSHRNSHTKNPIPAPIVTVRSEFPTLNRSRQQQSLTCLVTIEVPDGKWHPDPEDLRHGPPIPPTTQEQDFAMKSPSSRQPNEMSYDPPDVLDEITEELRVRVDNWHGLEFSR